MPMKFLATKDNLLNGINIVQKAISNKNAIPILSGIYLKAVEGRLFFAATDLELGIECRVPVQIIEEGEVVLPAKYLSELVRRLPDTNLMFEYQPETVSVKITYGQAETNIMGWRGEEFPTIPDLKDDYSFNVNPLVFKTMIKQTSFCANSEDARPIFTGALLEINNNDLVVVATDSHRIAYKKGKINNLTNEDFKAVVPIKSLIEISRIIKDDHDDLLNIRCNKNQICFENSELRMISRLIDGTFPNYTQVIPNDCNLLVKCKKKPLQEAIERANLFITEKDGTSVIKFHINDSNINISSKSDYGQVDENVQVYMEGSQLDITFNAKYLIDALKNMDFEDLEITFGGSLSPVVFRPLNDDKFLYLLLPLRS